MDKRIVVDFKNISFGCIFIIFIACIGFFAPICIFALEYYGAISKAKELKGENEHLRESKSILEYIENKLTSLSEKEVDLSGYVTHGQLEACLDHAYSILECPQADYLSDYVTMEEFEESLRGRVVCGD